MLYAWTSDESAPLSHGIQACDEDVLSVVFSRSRESVQEEVFGLREGGSVRIRLGRGSGVGRVVVGCVGIARLGYGQHLFVYGQWLMICQTPKKLAF